MLRRVEPECYAAAVWPCFFYAGNFISVFFFLRVVGGWNTVLGLRVITHRKPRFTSFQSLPKFVFLFVDDKQDDVDEHAVNKMLYILPG